MMHMVHIVLSYSTYVVNQVHILLRIHNLRVIHGTYMVHTKHTVRMLHMQNVWLYRCESPMIY
jgi:hypothetical protein